MKVPALDAVPPAELIESARDLLRQVPAGQVDDQRKELHFALGETTEQFKLGYELGLEVARLTVLLAPDWRDQTISIPNS